MKKYSLRGALLALCILALNPFEVDAKEKAFNFSTDDLKENAKKVGKDFLDTIVEVNEKLSEIPIYKQESLWLVTDIPNKDPSLERHYFFVDVNSLVTRTKTTFFDKEGNVVDKNSTLASRKLEQELYMYLTFSDVEKTIILEYDYDLINKTYTTNFVDFNEEYTWEENLKVDYGRFVDVSLVIPEELQKTKYSDCDLDEILKVINDCEYKLIDDALVLELK